MDITFNCEACGQPIAIDESGAGLQVQCPSCDQQLIVPRQQTPNQRSIVSVSSDSPATFRKTKRCPFCAEEVLAEAIKCKHCGSSLAQSPPAIQKKDEEKVFYQGAHVTVTQSRFIVGSETFAMRNITSVRTARRDPDYNGVRKIGRNWNPCSAQWLSFWSGCWRYRHWPDSAQCPLGGEPQANIYCSSHDFSR